MHLYDDIGDASSSLRGSTSSLIELHFLVLQDDQCALLAANDCFLGVDDDDNVVATSATAGKNEIVVIRCNTLR